MGLEFEVMSDRLTRQRMRDGAVIDGTEAFSPESLAAFAATPYDPRPVLKPSFKAWLDDATAAAEQGNTVSFAGDYAASFAFLTGRGKSDD